MDGAARRGFVGRRGVVVSLALVLLASACASRDREVAFEQRAAVVEGAGTGQVDDPSTATLEQGGLIGGDRAASAAGARVGAAGVGGAGAGGVAAGGRGPSRGVLKIGTVLPLTGGQREFGEPVLRVTQAFVDEVNAKGGVAGYELQLVAYDACLTCQPEALAAAKRLVEHDGVFAIVNPYVMVVAFIPVVPYLDSKRVPLVQGGSEEMTSDALSPITFATAPPGAFYGRFIPNVVKRYMQVRRIGLVYLDVATEREGIPVLEREFEREGIEVVHKESVRAAEDAVTSMDAAVSRMRLAGAEGAVATNPVLVAFGREAADRQGWDVPWYGPAAWSQLLEEACGLVCDDVVFTDTAGLSYVDRPSPQMQQFHEVMGRRYPEGARTGHELAAWVGMQFFVEVLARSGADADRFVVEAESIRNLDIGTTSPLTFNPDRHLGGTQTTVIMLKNGRYVRASEPLNFGYIEP